MTNFRKLWVVFTAALLVATTNAQQSDDTLATSTTTTFKVSSLSPNGQRIYADRRKLVADARTSLLGATVGNALLDVESTAQNTTREKLLAAQKAKAPEPTDAEIKAVYDANRDALAGRSLDEAREQIVHFVKHDAEEKLVDTFLIGLRAKHKASIGKDVNGIGLGPTEVLATIGNRTITVREFEQEHRLRLNDIEMEVFEELKGELETTIFSTLVTEEAKARNIDVSSYIAAEITDKLRQFSDEERAMIESDLLRRLFTKYNVKILLAEPAPVVQNISVDDDPQTGSATAPVTVVMFTDFQCPACARTHPVLKYALSGYADRVRFVVRDFPLEDIHKDAFQAALAANAARVQGKFNEYTDILYRNQDALDRASLVKYASELGLNVKQFELDFNSEKTAAEVRKDMADGESYGVNSTPTIFVNGVVVRSFSAAGFRKAIDRALKK
jgi:protein-disulfide isomerase